MIFGPLRHLHFIGVGGVGMCGLAEILLARGLTVSGCDTAPSERTRRLEELGGRISIGHDPAHLDGIDAVVVSAAVDHDTDELRAARERSLPLVRRSELLAELMRLRLGLAVAGTHGKTTTTALVAHVLTACGLDPTVVAGGRLHALASHARCGTGRHLVCEADEFDRSFLDLNPVWAVITNIEPEHVECYGTAEALDAAFVTFANRVPFWGSVVACADDPGVRRLLPELTGRAVLYGLADDADVQGHDLAPETAATGFTVSRRGRRLGHVRLPLHGRHNVLNALAAIAVGLELELSFPEITAALASFAGVARRFEVRGECDGVTVVDDYAHHPTELSAALAAGRQAFPGRRLVAVFQPPLFSRTREFSAAFGKALLAADVAVVLPVYAAREREIPGISSQLVIDAATRHGHPRVVAALPPDEALEMLREIVKPGDVILTLGAGDVHRLGESWLGVTP